MKASLSLALSAKAIYGELTTKYKSSKNGSISKKSFAIISIECAMHVTQSIQLRTYITQTNQILPYIIMVDEIKVGR